MAKSNASKLFEEHIEKAVLGVCVLGLLMAVWLWGLGEREIPVTPGAMANPETIDGQLATMAKSVGERNQKAAVPKKPIVDQTIGIIKMENAGEVDPTASVEVRSPGRYVEYIPIIPNKTTVDAVAKALPRPGKPQVTANVEVPIDDNPRDVVVAHPAFIYDWAALSQEWAKVLNGTVALARMKSAVALGVEAQVQEKQADGSWSVPRDVVKTAFMDRDGKPVTIPQMPAFQAGKTDPNAVRKFLADFAAQYEEIALEPGFPKIWEIQKRQWVSWISDLPKGILGELAPPSEEEPAATTKPAAKGAPAAPGIPSLEDQEKHGAVLAWFHDPTLQMRKAYRYRVRLALANPLLTYVQDVIDPKDASVPLVKTDWSDWSDEVSVQREVPFFVVGAGLGKVRVELFARFLGQELSTTVDVLPGQAIGGEVNKKVWNPKTGAWIAPEPKVDFSTGCVAVEANLEKLVQRGPATRQTTEILYLDEHGELKTKFAIKDEDRSSEEFQQYNHLGEEVRIGSTPPAPAKAP